MKLLLALLFLTLSLQAQDPIIAAIKLSNPLLVQKEIEKRAFEGNAISANDKLLYLNFCEEIITRRRNALQFPEYQTTPLYCNGMITYYSQPVYKKAFITDEEPEISFNCGLRFALGSLRTIAALLYWHNSITNYKCTYSKTTNNAIIASGVISLIALFSAIIEIDINRKQYQEELYENAIKIKHIIYGIEKI